MIILKPVNYIVSVLLPFVRRDLLEVMCDLVTEYSRDELVRLRRDMYNAVLIIAVTADAVLYSDFDVELLGKAIDKSLELIFAIEISL